MICSIVEPDNRIRIETAITAVEQLDRNALLACLAGNSGDVYFCVRDGQLLCVFQYFLDALSDGALIDAIHRVVAHAGNLAAANPPVVLLSPQATTTDTPLSSSHPNWTPLLKALSDDTRLRLTAELLSSAQSVEELADHLDLTHYNTSKHLQILREAGVIASHKQGRLVISCHRSNFSSPRKKPGAGFEIPWGNVQLAHIYDSARVPEPPRSMDALATWVKAHPGRFTFDTGFTGLTFLKGLLYALAEPPQALQGPFDEAVYARLSARLWDYRHQLQPYLWRQGKTFPSSVAELQQLFVNGEIDFTMGNNDAEVELQVRNGIFPDTAHAYVFDSGSIQNSHYLGITRQSAQLAAAMVVGNFLISPEAQLEKIKFEVWGDGTILDINRLPKAWRDQFLALPPRVHAPDRAELRARALMEPAPEYMIRLF